MSNPQINSLEVLGELQNIETDILNILQNYKHITLLCSHEILAVSNTQTLSAITRGIGSHTGGFSIPASWIGSVASSMTKQGRIKQTFKDCIFNGTKDEAWSLL